MNVPHPHLSGCVEKPALTSVEPYISETYARDESERLWLRVWQSACREEEIPNPGDYFTYDILDQSVIIVRKQDGELAAWHNACRHRGRKLTEGCGRASHFHCPYHGWQWELDGENRHVLGEEDWGGELTPEHLRLRPVMVETWGGFVFVNLDPDCGPLEEFLGEIPYWVGAFQVEKMRYKWRKWMRFPCNWKVVVEAFIEGYHAPATHPQVMRYGGGMTGSSSEGLHGRLFSVGTTGGGIGTALGDHKDYDIRELPYLAMKQADETIWSNTTDSFIEAAAQLKDLLPDDVSGAEVSSKLMSLARDIDARRGVEWPDISPEHMMNVGINWHVFPNSVILPNVTYALNFRIKPDGFNPDSCLMEVFALERYPDGNEPQTAWVEAADLSNENWPLLLRQDFKNMAAVQQGMKSVSMKGGMAPNPTMEATIINFQRNLARYMERCEPVAMR